MAKRLVELDDEAIRHGRERLIDVDFVREHTVGFSDFVDDLRAESWVDSIAESGVSREDIDALTQVYARGKPARKWWRASGRCAARMNWASSPASSISCCPTCSSAMPNSGTGRIRSTARSPSGPASSRMRTLCCARPGCD
ncbi:hypothetical protein CBM2609_B120129 [Cupriavidus taiwanensis]|nr:hypothetical protein CBM2604_B130130 [Cupriavidus taiwanensis]SOZ31170.1 hypothetical protein CBM2609_B120129 [Cupriavidus taiwanensis]SOZ47247.1 hypothetical protein CBM2610_B100129 [Cupriavidus taiwanensis]